MRRWMRTLIGSAVTLTLLAGPGSRASAQVEEEDLAFADPLQGSADELQELFDRALTVFNSVDQPQSVPLWTELISLLDAPPAMELEIRDGLLAASLFRRAETYFNLGQNAEAEADLARALLVAPALAPDEAESSPKLLELFRRVRDRTIGRLTLAVEPPDARLEIDGVPFFVTLLDGIRLLAGPHTVRVSRPGFTAQTAEVKIASGAATPLGIELERASAVVKVRTNVADVEVLVDGQSGGRTALLLPAGEATSAEGTGGVVFAEALVDGLQVGVHEVTLVRDGYRPLAVRVAVEALVDYELTPFTLEETRGTLALSGIPSGARVRVDGVESTAAVAAGALRLELPVGQHEVAVELGSVGAFVERIELADRQGIELAVRLAPRATLLGVLGGDLAAAERLTRDLAGAFGRNPHWRFENHSAAAPTALSEVGVDASALRAGPQDERAPDWHAVQDLADRRFTGSVYLLAVLSDDLYATDAQVFLWAAAPGPALPEMARVSLEDPVSLTSFVERFSAPPVFARPWLGATLFDGADGVVVAGILPDGPAALAGLAVGDRLTVVGGRSVTRQAEVDTALVAFSREAASDAGFDVTVRRGETERTLSLGALAASPVVLLEVEPELPVAVAAAWLNVARVAGGVPEWVLGLNEAAGYLRLGAWADAVRSLRALEAPAGPGLGQAAVDYWLGVALLETDPAAYDAQARAALERAAAAADGRLAHHDGPPVAPRARARLEALD
jgi:hypothetical protein